MQTSCVCDVIQLVAYAMLASRSLRCARHPALLLSCFCPVLLPAARPLLASGCPGGYLHPWWFIGAFCQQSAVVDAANCVYCDVALE